MLTHDPGMYPKRVIVHDARLAGIPVLPLDVNASGAGWLVEEPSSRTEGGSSPEGIRVSLREVKGISDAEVDRIIAGQPYASLRDFRERARVSRPVTERLVLAGGFDSLYAHARPALTRRDLLARTGVLARQAPPARDVPALNLFAGTEASDGMTALVPAGQLRDLDPAERVAAELEILGFDASRCRTAARHGCSAPGCCWPAAALACRPSEVVRVCTRADAGEACRLVGHCLPMWEYPG